MKADTTSPELRFALDVVREGALLAQRIRAELVVSALTKSDESPVTVGDFAVQALVGRELHRHFPEDPLIAEESTQTLAGRDGSKTLDRVCHFLEPLLPESDRQEVLGWIDHGTQDTAPRYWTLDPIDGTKGFLRGGQYAVALALVEDGKVQVGVLGCPRLSYTEEVETDGPGVLVAAARGEGAWTTSLEQPKDFTRLLVSTRDDVQEARILQSYESGHTNDEQMMDLLKRLNVRRRPIRIDSQAKYALLASGVGDLLLKLLSRPSYHQKIWDHAAGVLIVEEAGGLVTDLQGKELDFSAGKTLARNVGVMASNGRCHERVLETLKEIGGSAA